MNSMDSNENLIQILKEILIIKTYFTAGSCCLFLFMQNICTA